jgi:hypothetical protein
MESASHRIDEVWISSTPAASTILNLGLRALVGLLPLGMSWEHAFDAEFLRGDALRCTDSCDQGEVREVLITSPKGDG